MRLEHLLSRESKANGKKEEKDREFLPPSDVVSNKIKKEKSRSGSYGRLTQGNPAGTLHSPVAQLVRALH